MKSRKHSTKLNIYKFKWIGFWRTAASENFYLKSETITSLSQSWLPKIEIILKLLLKHVQILWVQACFEGIFVWKCLFFGIWRVLEKFHNLIIDLLEICQLTEKLNKKAENVPLAQVKPSKLKTQKTFNFDYFQLSKQTPHQ